MEKSIFMISTINVYDCRSTIEAHKDSYKRRMHEPQDLHEKQLT